jgi:hypothetical protein
MTYLAIDPGRHTGWALFDNDRKLIKCGLASETEFRYPPIKREDMPRLEHVLIEQPNFLGRANLEDVVKLSILVGKYSERFRDVEVKLIFPVTWKGSVEKSVMTNRILRDIETLTPEEKKIVLTFRQHCAASYSHNTIDAIGLGLAAFKKGIWV